MLTGVDEASVREHAQAHGDAVVAGDLRRAGSDLDGEALAQAGGVMKQLPETITAAELVSVELAGDTAIVRTRYSGDESEGTVECRWEDREGRPKIVDMKVV
jgi:uncharacterized protein YodC (DUF2158 family)